MALIGVPDPNSIFLSPLASITIPPFRNLCGEFGAITVSEMTSARALLHRNPRTLARIQRLKQEKTFGIQLVTNDAHELGLCIEYLEQNRCCDFIELNLGCPKPKITSARQGAALLDPKHKETLKQLLEIGGTTANLPFSIKIRAGYFQVTFLEVLRLAERYNIAFVTLHARLACDTYGQKAKPSYWAEAVRESALPIIANGDISGLEEAQSIILQYKVRGVAIGRAARGNPQVFYRNEETIAPLDVYDKLIGYMKESAYFNRFNVRLHSSDFLKRFRFAARARQELQRKRDAEGIVSVTRRYLKDINSQ